MARTLIVSDKQNSFFTANNIKVGTEIPTSGTYSKGDIIVNIGNNTATEAMWICVEAGTPGTWEVVGAGAGGGGSIVAINDTVTVNNSVTEVSLGNLVGKISSSDKLIVHYNSTHLMEGVDYEVNSEGTSIVKLTEGSWNESGEQALFAFELFKNVESVNGNEIVVDTKLTSIVNNMMITAPTTEVEIGVEGFDKNRDTLLVFKNGVIMVEGVDYNVSEDNAKIISINEAWNESNVEEYGITFVVFKEVVVYDESTGGITMGMLGSDVREIINNLTETTLQHSNLLEDIDENYATKEDLENIEVDLSPYQQKTDDNLATTDKSIVGAINELFQSANNGKELIASAIGEPLNAEDTFQAMSTDINGLLSTFKTNMMNNGITVESTDKFKSLIDKIATLADSEGKGTQFMVGSITIPTLGDGYYTYTKTYTTTLDLGLEFKPSTVYILDYNYLAFYDYYNGGKSSNTINISNTNQSASLGWGDFTSIVIDDDGVVTLTIGCTTSGYGVHADEQTCEFIAIGVGEEDTTLRDSLASILEDEGVTVTEEDDMASLITKVDEEFDRKTNEMESNKGLDIISATELPATGKENQICVVTDNPVNAFITTTNFDDTNSVSNDYITLYLGNTASSDTTEGTLIELNQGNLVSKYYFVKACQGENRLDSYYWLNNQWNRLTQSGIYFVENGVERNHDYFGGIPNGSGAEFNTNGLTLLYLYSDPYKAVTTKNTINFSLYDKLDITIRNPDTSNSYEVCVGFASTDHFTSYGWYPDNSSGGNEPGYSNVTDAYQEINVTSGQTVSKTIDISSWTGEGWLFLATYNGNMEIYITDLKLY